MKILIVSAFSDRPEVELYAELQRRGHALDLICSPKDPRLNELRTANIHIIEKNIQSRLDFASAHFIRRLHLENRYDVIYATDNRGLACAQLGLLGLKPVLVAYRGTLGNLSRFDPSSYLTHLSGGLSGILCNCQAVQRYLANLGVSDSVLKVIYKGHLPQWYQHANSRSRSEFQLSADDFVIGIVANVRPLKGIDVLLHAFKALENQTAKLIVVGALRGEALPALADELGIATRVQFTGYLSDVISLYPLFDVFVMPSVEREGFPKAVIEAASCAVPAIVSDVGGMPEIVEDGFTGYVVPPADVGALKSAIGRIQELPDRGAALGQAARARVEQKFHFSTFCDQVESWFTELSSAS